MSTVATVVVSDRGDLYLPGCLDNLAQFGLTNPTVINDSAHHLGMAGAVRAAWDHIGDADYLLHVEEDFRLLDLPLPAMIYILERNPHLAQVVLKRQPGSPEEAAAGGIIECHPDEYTDHAAFGRNIQWTEHRRIFSLNPCLIPRRVVELGWPDGNEAGFTEVCLEAGYSFAFYGPRTDPPRVTHVGTQRSAGWRL